MLVLQVLGAFRYMANEWKLWRHGKRVIVICLVGALAMSNGQAMAANEARCTELGTNCIGSEPLNTATYTDPVDNHNWNPSDTNSPDKELNLEGGTGDVINTSGTVSTLTGVTTGEMFTAMPATKSASIVYLAKGPVGGSAGFIGHSFSGASPTARRAYRWYEYYSTDFQLENGACTNHSKIVQFGRQPSLSAIISGNGSYLIYGWIGWMTDPLDCCVRGPGANTAAYEGTYTQANIRGKWFRFELIITNVLTTGSTSVIQLYMRNITDGTDEVLLIDTSTPTTQAVGTDWTSTFATTLKPVATALDQMWIDSFVNGTCAGFHGFTHLLAAAWSTDAGQRIGAATEIEGSGGGGSSSTAIYVMIMKSVGPISIGLESMVFGSFLFSSRASIKQFAVAAQRYCQSLPSPHDLYWMMCYRHAVKRWQRQAPTMLPLPREQSEQKERYL